MPYNLFPIVLLVRKHPASATKSKFSDTKEACAVVQPDASSEVSSTVCETTSPAFWRKSGVLGSLSTFVAGWFGSRITNGLDAFIRGAAGAAGAAAVLSEEGLFALLQNIIETVSGAF